MDDYTNKCFKLTGIPIPTWIDFLRDRSLSCWGAYIFKRELYLNDDKKNEG